MSRGGSKARTGIGTCDTFATYATVKDEASGFPKDVQVRAFAIQAT